MTATNPGNSMNTPSRFTPVTVYTLGHSNRTGDALLALLRATHIRQLVDVRAHPSSQRFPQFDADRLRGALDEAGILYHWAGRHLGGRRSARADSLHIALQDVGLRAYADHMGTVAFERAAQQLVNLARRAPLVILCAEKQPEHCHRALIADYLTLQGHRVLHLIDETVTEEHLLNRHARRESARLVYDRLATKQLALRQ